MRRLYAFQNRNPPLSNPIPSNVEDVRVIRTKKTYVNDVTPNNDKTIVRKTTTNDVIENYDNDVTYTDTNNVYLNETCRCPYLRFPWWVWLLLGLGLLTLLGLALGLGLGLGLRSSSINSRCRGGDCPANSQCINNRCECNTGYFYDYTTSTCSAYRHVGMTCTTSNTDQQCVSNAHCASNGYCVCDTDYFLDQNNGVCTALLARYVPCASDDQCQTPFVCKVSLCDCNQTSYYDSGTNTCKRLGWLNEPCSTNSQCVQSANCSTVTCQCAPDHYFDSEEYHCVRDQFIGGSCTVGYECIQNANCTSVSPFSSQCECNSGLYYNTLQAICTTQLSYSTTCTTTYACVNNLVCIDDPSTTGASDFKCLCLSRQYYLSTNATCISYATYDESCNAGGRPCETRYGLSCSAVTFTCQCDSINYWNGTICVPRLYPGQTCSSTSQCINSSSCVSFICTCDTNYYYSTLTGICTPQLSYLTSCVLGDYQCLNNTSCYNLIEPPAICSCDTTTYYYDGSRCTEYETYGESCASTVFGPFCETSTSLLVCTSSTCTCPSTMYYNGSRCVDYTMVGFSCANSSECVTNAECSSSSICECSSSYYFNTATGVCVALLSFGENCSSTVQCSTNLTCTSSQCLCDSTSYYSGSACVARVSNGGSCSASILCDTTLGLSCISSVCSCNSSQYWSTLGNGTQICANLRTLGQSCSSETDCANYATSVSCVSSICECDSSGYYLDQTNIVCVPLKIDGVACTPTYHFECASFNCDSTNVCAASSITSNVTTSSLAIKIPARQIKNTLIYCFFSLLTSFLIF